MAEHSKEFNEGVAAKQAKVPLHLNPYRPDKGDPGNDVKGWQWRDGWQSV